MAKKSEIVMLDDLTVIHETEKAVLLTNGTVKAWVPKSVAQVDADGMVQMPRSWAEDKGLV